ncbi:MAG: serine--tRNA ligase [Alphaproteobacteria bacterium]|nr:serine--tRNA ligase [Alphaproteobacteria bacterium]
MYDIKWIRENPAEFDAGLKRRGFEPHSEKVLALDKKYRSFQTDLQDMQSRRNELSKKIGELKRNGEDAEVLMHEVDALKRSMAETEDEVRKVCENIDHVLEALPNRPADDIPDGLDDKTNKEIRRWGTPREFDFKPLEHDELGEKLGLIDFEQAAKVSGARFVYLKGDLSRLERALAQYMLDMHTTEHGYMEMEVPLMVKSNAVYGTAQLPKFAEDLYKTAGTDEFWWLIPTAEVSLTNYVAGKVLDEEKLPLRITSLTPCFRSEAGAAGRDTKGMIRQHQFYKVEMVSITTPEKSWEEHEHMTNCAENILKGLNLPYRVMCLSAGDMGFSSRKTHDLEVWLPGQNKYREISSVSNCWDFQARRMDARCKNKNQKGTRYVHTLNGSGLAVGRTLVAVMENYQQKDGSILIPEALRKYMNGKEVITSIR